MMTEGDEKQLSQVFLDLLKNAMQALEGHPHGELSLQAEQDEHIVIDITDNGPGIPPEIMDKVFIPFFTTKSEGTGIGLSLCKEIIRRHEGHLAIKESRAGKTVFILSSLKNNIRKPHTGHSNFFHCSFVYKAEYLNT